MKCLMLIGTLFVSLLACGGCASHRAAGKASSSDRAVQIYLVRHARAYRNEPHPAEMSAEQLDSLAPHGIAQAKEAGESLVKKHIVAVYASPTHRTMQTGDIIAETTHAKGPIATDAFGPMAQGEPLSSGLDRAMAGLEAVARQHPGQAIVIVTHGDLCPLLIGQARGTPLGDRLAQDTIEPGKVVHLVWDNGRLRMP